ncbi:MAG TPA: M48 family metallopeptidase [Burkholderiales bacterium]|nr:M48 family metallopeptidase [Burkholderiales bacterium]
MKFSVWFCLFAAMVLAACETVQTTQGGVVGVERRQSMSSLVSSSQMDRSAAQAYRQVIAEAAKKNQLNRDPAEVARVRGIADRLIPSTAAFRADAPKWNWEVNVISSDEVNAWCMPGGKIAVYTGLLIKLNPTDDELAAVMGHEIAHALREHGRERASEQMAQQIGVSVLSTALGLGDLGAQLTQTVLDVTLALPHSRTHETEADRIGVELAARSGYDPRAAVSLWQKMGNLGGGKPPEWMSTHPSDQTRIRDLQNYSDRVIPLYEAAHRR